VISDDGFRIGQLTASGTLNLLAIGTLLGVLGGAIYLVVRNLMIEARRVKTQRPQRARARTYGLDAAGEPVARLVRRGSGRVGTTRRGGAGRCAALLMFACRDRMSGMRRMVPLTKCGCHRRGGGP
jgi:hypothetical protein